MKCRIHAQTPYSRGAKGRELPTRLVLVELQKIPGEIYEFATYYQTNTGALYCGNYHITKEDGFKDFFRRLTDANDSFPKGSISHIPFDLLSFDNPCWIEL